MKELYIRAMDKLFMVCMWISGICLMVLTTVIRSTCSCAT